MLTAALILLLGVAVVALVAIAYCTYALTFDRQLEINARRLAAEQRIEQTTRATLRAMRRLAQPPRR